MQGCRQRRFRNTDARLERRRGLPGRFGMLLLPAAGRAGWQARWTSARMLKPNSSAKVNTAGAG
jgi:hypothetical protein